MTTAKKIAEIAKITGKATIGTAISSAKHVAVAAPIAIAVTAVANKAVHGSFNVKGAAIEVGKRAAITIGALTAMNAVTTAFNATNMAIHNCGEFADTDDTQVEEFDDWDEEDEEA